MDTRVVARASEIAAEKPPSFYTDLFALEQATRDVIPAGQVHLLGEYGGQPIFGSLVSGVGIVASDQGTLLVKVSVDGLVQVLGLFR